MKIDFCFAGILSKIRAVSLQKKWPENIQFASVQTLSSGARASFQMV